MAAVIIFFLCPGYSVAAINLSVDYFLFEFSSFYQKTEKPARNNLKIYSFFPMWGSLMGDQ